MKLIMKKILIFLLMCYLAQGCILIRGWEYYAVDEPGGRAYLKDMKFKDSFEPEMANYIDDNVVYVGTTGQIGHPFQPTLIMLLFASSKQDNGYLLNVTR